MRITLNGISTLTPVPEFVPYLGNLDDLPIESGALEADGLPLPQSARWPVAPAPNVICYPQVGMTRYARGHVLISDEDFTTLTGTAGYPEVEALIDESVSIDLVVVSYRQLVDTSATMSTDTAATANGWILTLSDSRYAMQRVLHDGSPDDMTSWDTLLASLASRIDCTVSLPTITAPAEQDSGHWDNCLMMGRHVTVIIDSIAALLGLRTVLNGDVIDFQYPADAQTLHSSWDVDNRSEGGLISAGFEIAGLQAAFYGIDDTIVSTSLYGIAPYLDVQIPDTASNDSWALEIQTQYADWMSNSVFEGRQNSAVPLSLSANHIWFIYDERYTRTTRGSFDRVLISRGNRPVNTEPCDTSGGSGSGPSGSGTSTLPTDCTVTGTNCPIPIWIALAGSQIVTSLTPVSGYTEIPGGGGIKVNYRGWCGLITAASWSAGVATITSAGHPLLAGDTITVYDVRPHDYNVSTVEVTSVTADTISYGLTSNPGTYVSSGVVRSDTVEYCVDNPVDCCPPEVAATCISYADCSASQTLMTNNVNVAMTFRVYLDGSSEPLYNGVPASALGGLGPLYRYQPTSDTSDLAIVLSSVTGIVKQIADDAPVPNYAGIRVAGFPMKYLLVGAESCGTASVTGAAINAPACGWFTIQTDGSGVLTDVPGAPVGGLYGAWGLPEGLADPTCGLLTSTGGITGADRAAYGCMALAITIASIEPFPSADSNPYYLDLTYNFKVVETP